MSRASLVRCSCPWRVKLIFPQTHLPCLTSIWVMSTAVSGNQRPTGCGPGPAKRSPRIVRGSPPAMSIPPPAMSIALRQSQMDIFDFILLSRDRFYGRPRRQGFAALAQTSWGAPGKRPPGDRRVVSAQGLSSETSTKAIILPNPQALPNPSVLAVKGSASPLRALDGLAGTLIRMIVAGADQDRQTIDHDPLDESHLACQPPGGRVYSRVVEEGFPEGRPPHLRDPDLQAMC